MRTLSDHIFDLVQNSLNAGAQNIRVIVEENVADNHVNITIKDDGYGIRPDQLSKIKDTFFTTRPRNKRRVGLGLSLMDAACQRAGGELSIESEYRHGTTVMAAMEYDNIDRSPLGDLPDMFTSLLLSTVENQVIWHLEHLYNENRYCLRNRTTLDELNILSYAEPGVKDKLYQFILNMEEEIHR